MSAPDIDLFGNEVTDLKLIDRDVLAGVLFESLRDLSLEDFAAMLTNRFDATIAFARLCQGEQDGQKISLCFNPHRLDTSANGGKTIFNSLKDEGFLSGLARAVLFKEGRVNELLYQVIQLGINGVQYVNEFPPHVAVDLYKRFALPSGGIRILDPCAGWGGRMIAAAAIGARYVGFEPCTDTWLGLLDLGTWLEQFQTGFTFSVFKMPFEDAQLPPGTFDIALTSPPYYDTERYSDEPTQSCNRYRTFDAWVSGFYRPLIYKAIEALKPGAVLILNVGDRRYPLATELRKEWGGQQRLIRGFRGVGDWDARMTAKSGSMCCARSKDVIRRRKPIARSQKPIPRSPIRKRRSKPRRGRVIDRAFMAWVHENFGCLVAFAGGCGGSLTWHHLRDHGSQKDDTWGLFLCFCHHEIQGGSESI